MADFRDIAVLVCEGRSYSYITEVVGVFASGCLACAACCEGSLADE